MELRLDFYMELSFLRREISKIQFKLAKTIHKQTKIDMTKLMKVKKWKLDEDGNKIDDYILPVGDLDCCNIILDKITDIEKELKPNEKIE